MQPTILQMLNGQNLGQIKQTISILRSMSNPQTAMQQLIQSRNPQMLQAIEYVKQHGGDPKTAFQALAQERGINPEEIESLIK